VTFSLISESADVQSVAASPPQQTLEPTLATTPKASWIVEDCRSPEALQRSQETLNLPIQPSISPTAEKKSGFFNVFLSTFLTIFLAELGDKTQIATLLMSAESHAPWVVFAGAAAALIATSLIGVLVGQWLSSRLSPKTLDNAAGVTLLLVSVLLTWDVLKG
jgi:putative Ca2+/H+ antiporter (TMEM165/GDT1 family)